MELNKYKEVFEKVLEIKIKDIYALSSNPNFGPNEMLYSIPRRGDLENINIYELAHLCRVWAIKNKHRIDCGPSLMSPKERWWGHLYNGPMSTMMIFNTFADSEPEVVFECALYLSKL